jgi:hypothetical protein
MDTQHLLYITSASYHKTGTQVKWVISPESSPLLQVDIQLPYSHQHTSQLIKSVPFTHLAGPAWMWWRDVTLVTSIPMADFCLTVFCLEDGCMDFKGRFKIESPLHGNGQCLKTRITIQVPLLNA